MKGKNPYNINISLPNLINICVDEMRDGEISGRLYHCYDEQPVLFCNVIELLMEAEELFDRISFPQASTRTRYFHEKGSEMPSGRPQKAVEQTDIIEHRGKMASIAVGVQFRQNATWQGEYVRMETGNRKRFSNTLNFLKLLDHELENVNA